MRAKLSPPLSASQRGACGKCLGKFDQLTVCGNFASEAGCQYYSMRCPKPVPLEFGNYYYLWGHVRKFFCLLSFEMA